MVKKLSLVWAMVPPSGNPLRRWGKDDCSAGKLLTNEQVGIEIYYAHDPSMSGGLGPFLEFEDVSFRVLGVNNRESSHADYRRRRNFAHGSTARV
jgi:hypothetical protein